MSNALPSRRLVIGGIALTAALSGCTDTPAPKLFTLAPRPGQLPAAAGSTSPTEPMARGASAQQATPAGRTGSTRTAASTKISVKPVQIAKYLDRPQIVRYSDAYELRTLEFERWGEGFGDMTTRVLTENLTERLPRYQVFAASGALTTTGDVSLEVDLIRFEPDAQGTVLLDARWEAVRREGRQDRIRAEQIRVKMASDDATAQVAAMSDALGQLADRIAAVLAA